MVASETGHVYTFATPKLQPLITKQEGKNLIQACLNSPDHHTPVIPEYLPSGHHYENDLADDELLVFGIYEVWEIQHTGKLGIVRHMKL